LPVSLLQTLDSIVFALYRQTAHLAIQFAYIPTKPLLNWFSGQGRQDIIVHQRGGYAIEDRLWVGTNVSACSIIKKQQSSLPHHPVSYPLPANAL
jgi:hypothetical protein